MFDKIRKIFTRTVDEVSEIDEAIKELDSTTSPNDEPIYRAIIDGVLYDTSKSELILDYYSGKRHSRIEIYRGSNNKFFELLSFWKEINPIDEKEVKEILGIYNTNKYIELFGEPEEA